MRARDIMTSPVHTVWPNAPVETAADLMTGKSVTALPVVDAGGGLIGMINEGDLLRHRVSPDPSVYAPRTSGGGPERRPGTVVEVMSENPRTVWPDADLAEVAEIMLRFGVRSMPVVEDGTVVGIISRRDILRVAVRGDDVLTREVQHRLDEYAEGQHRWTAAVEGGTATVSGAFVNDTERAVVTVLARTVPGVAAVKVDALAAAD